MTGLTADRYFIDAEAARDYALQAHRAWQHGDREKLEVVYCHNPLPDDISVNLVQLPMHMMSAYFLETTLPLPNRIEFPDEVIEEATRQEVMDVFAAARESVESVRKNLREAHEGLAPDTYFVDRTTALLTALQRNRVRLKHPTVTGLQICYFDGENRPGDPENLIAVKAEDFLPFFTRCRLRFPTQIVPPPQISRDQRRSLKNDFKALFEEIHRQKEVITLDLIAKARQLEPPPIEPGKPLRILLPSNRQTTVMQYVSRNLAAALDAAGHEALVSIERNEMENIDTQAALQDYLDFRPQVIFNINHENTYFLNDDVHNVIWWQDPMPALQRGDPLRLRQRDHMLSYSPQIDRLLEQCGAKRILRQHFCVDPGIFHTKSSVQRQDKIVFVGSSYRRLLHANPRDRQVLDALYRKFEAGEPIDKGDTDRLAGEFGVDPHHAFWHLLHYTIRDLSVRWLCRSSPIPVEVYGRDWEDDEFVAPHHRGLLSHGSDVANTYRSARYALVVHPFEVNSQRLAEAAACGCIPVIFDCRHSAEAPYWEQHALYYSTEQELRDALGRQPEQSPTEIATEFTYRTLAERVVELVGAGNSVSSTLETLASMK